MKAPVLPLLSALALLAGGLPAASALDFTFRHGQVNADGAAVGATYVTDGNHKIYLRIPNTWKTTDRPEALELFPGPEGCVVRLENVGATRALPLDETGKAALRQQIDAAVPIGAKNVVALPERDNPLPINNWKDVELTRSYDFYGQQIIQSMMFINMIPGRVIRVTITALKPEYEKIQTQVQVLLFSWSEPDPNVVLQPNGEVRGGS